MDGQDAALQTGRTFVFLPGGPVTGSALKGPENGGTSIAIDGSYLPEATYWCIFGDSRALAAKQTAGALECVSPPSAPSTQPLRVTNAAAEQVFTAAFTYYPVAAIHRIVPDSGPVLGGSTIVVHGTNFRNDSSLACRFHGRATHATYVSPRAIQCVSPPQNFHTARSLSVTVATGLWSSTAVLFAYYPSPEKIRRAHV